MEIKVILSVFAWLVSGYLTASFVHYSVHLDSEKSCKQAGCRRSITVLTFGGPVSVSASFIISLLPALFTGKGMGLRFTRNFVYKIR